MGIVIESIKFYDQLVDTTNSIDYLLANKFDKIKAVISFKVNAYAQASNANKITFCPSSGYLENNHVTATTPVFKEFATGDSITIDGDPVYNGNYTITQKVSNYDIIVDFGVLSLTPDYESTTALIYFTNSIKAIRFNWNLIENGAAVNFASIIDGSTQEAYVASKLCTSTSSSNMVLNAPKTWQEGTLTIKGVGTNTSPIYEQRYEITQYFHVDKYLIASQYSNTLAGIAPAYFLSANALKYVFKITAQTNINDVNRKFELTVSDKAGNTGWMDENFNGRPTNYYIDSVVYKNAGGDTITALEKTGNTQTVEITVKNTVDAPFTNKSGIKPTGTPFNLNFIRTPDSTNLYQNNARTPDVNFMFDNAQGFTGGAAVAGLNNATTRQVFTEVLSTFVSTSEILITATVILGADILIDFETGRKSYLLAVSVAEEDSTRLSSDKVTLFVDAQNLYENEYTAGFVSHTNTFLRHYENETADGVTSNFECFVEDEITTRTRVAIDTTGFTGTWSIKSMEARVIAYKPEPGDPNTKTDEWFYLDSYKQDFTGVPVLPSGQQQIDASIDRPFNVPAAEIRKSIKVKTRSDLQSGDLYYFDFYFPFMARWEYWKPNAEASLHFFDSNQPLNGLNQKWYSYQEFITDGWVLGFEFETVVLKNGQELTYTDLYHFDLFDYFEGVAWQPDTIRFYDPDTNTQLINAGTLQDYIYKSKNTLVEAEFTDAVGLTEPEICVVFGIEVFEEGGIEGRRRFSTVNEMANAETWFTSINGDKLATIDISTPGLIKSRCLINYNNLPNKSKYKISARLYQVDAVTGTFKATEAGAEKITEATGLTKLIE